MIKMDATMEDFTKKCNEEKYDYIRQAMENDWNYTERMFKVEGHLYEYKICNKMFAVIIKYMPEYKTLTCKEINMRDAAELMEMKEELI